MQKQLNQESLAGQSICFKLQLHDAVYRVRFHSNSLIHILSLSNSHNNVASIQKNRGDKSHHVIVALDFKDVATRDLVLGHVVFDPFIKTRACI